MPWSLTFLQRFCFKTHLIASSPATYARIALAANNKTIGSLLSLFLPVPNEVYCHEIDMRFKAGFFT